MKILSKEALKTLPMDKKLELMDFFLSESRGQDQIPTSQRLGMKSRLASKPFLRTK